MSRALPVGEGAGSLCLIPALGCTAHGARTSLDACQLPRLFWSPCYQQVQARVSFWCEKGGIDGNKQLKLVGQVLQVTYGRVLGIFPIPLPPRCLSWLTLSSAELILDSIHTRNANAMPTGVQRWLVRLTIRSLSKLGWHSNLKSDAK